jgi:hypothetical protein
VSRRGPSNTSTKRLQRRAEREAQAPTATPRARRERTGRPAQTVKTGFLSNLNIPLILGILGGVIVVVFIVYAVMQASKDNSNEPLDWQKAELNSSSSIPGQYIAPHPGSDGKLCTVASCVGTMDDRLHVPQVIPICDQKALDAQNYSNPLCYQSNPPTSGPHNANPMPFKVLDNPAPKESLVHNMEHGGVVVWYNTDDQNIIKQLTDITNDELNRRKLVVMSKYTEMEPNTIAVTSWTRLDKFPTSDFNKKRVTDFIEENNKRFNPEGF